MREQGHEVSEESFVRNYHFAIVKHKAKPAYLDPVSISDHVSQRAHVQKRGNHATTKEPLRAGLHIDLLLLLLQWTFRSRVQAQSLVLLVK